VDAKYIKGMINILDIQPSATINRWIAGILLFDFKLRHVSAKDHTPADGLSRRPPSDKDPEVPNDTKDWIDEAYGFGFIILNDGLHADRKSRLKTEKRRGRCMKFKIANQIEEYLSHSLLRTKQP
jgi:hypothetical protein